MKVIDGQADASDRERYEELSDELQSSPLARVDELRNIQ